MHVPSPDAIQITLTICTLAALWVGWAKGVRPRVKAKWDWLVGILQSIGGRDPIIDKRTGIELSPKVPSLGVQLLSIDKRFETVNENMAQLIEVVKSNQDAHHRIDNIEGRVDVVEGTVSALVANTIERSADRAMEAVKLTAAGQAEIIDAEETP